jgi:hypothetical protein
MTGITLLDAIVGRPTSDLASREGPVDFHAPSHLVWRSMLDILQKFRVQLMLSQDLVKNKRRGVS